MKQLALIVAFVSGILAFIVGVDLAEDGNKAGYGIMVFVIAATAVWYLDHKEDIDKMR